MLESRTKSKRDREERTEGYIVGLENEYPTDAQIEEMWAAFESDDPDAIKKVLEQRRQERAALRKATEQGVTLDSAQRPE
jgi:hypothetical protein